MPGHKLSKYFLLVHQEEDTEGRNSGSPLQSVKTDSTSIIPSSDLPITTQQNPPTPHISLHALVGNAVTETLGVNGIIENKDIIILIDARSTHNFIQDRVVKLLEQVSQSSNFSGYGRQWRQIAMQSFCFNVPITLEKT